MVSQPLIDTAFGWLTGESLYLPGLSDIILINVAAGLSWTRLLWLHGLITSLFIQETGVLVLCLH